MTIFMSLFVVVVVLYINCVHMQETTEKSTATIVTNIATVDLEWAGATIALLVAPIQRMTHRKSMDGGKEGGELHTNTC